MTSQVLVEVCVDSVSSSIAAERGGAARVELCSGLIEGGVTPSAGLIEMTRGAVSLALHVMIRPRAGDFCYDAHEFEIMRHDIVLAKRIGANGVVFGILDVNGRVDIDRTHQLVELANPLEVTFHRAFDMTDDLLHALEDVCTAGAQRVLTSGGEQTAWHGRTTIAQLIKRAQGRIAIMAGSGIRPENARSLIEQTSVREIHVGLRSSMDSPMQFRNQRVSLGTVDGREYQRFTVREEDVRRLCKEVATEN
jgi:copper homeostasis protein